jgi:hypothetical protein
MALPKGQGLIKVAKSDLQYQRKIWGHSCQITTLCCIPDSKPCNCLKYRQCSWRDPIFLFFYFRPPTYFFWHFKIQNWSLQSLFSLGNPILGIHSMERRGLILEGANTNKYIGARFFHYEVFSIQDSHKL